MTMQPPNVTAVMVSYNPDSERCRALIESAASQVGHVIVVDNGSRPPALAVLRQLRREGQCELVEIGANTGIASAQNKGIAIALDRATDYVLLLDHDSVLSQNCVAQLVAAHRRLTESGVAVGAVGPQYADESSGVKAPFLRYGRYTYSRIYDGLADQCVESSILIASGSLISHQALAAVGLMDESLFIDGVDWDWCFRAAARGYRIFGCTAASMMHNLGIGVLHVMGRTMPLHGPLRHYYVYRNALLLCRRKEVPFSWKLSFLAKLLVRFLIYVMWAPERRRRCHYIVRGLLDGIAKRTGPIPLAEIR
jgi:rhamnosyltransferase